MLGGQLAGHERAVEDERLGRRGVSSLPQVPFSTSQEKFGSLPSAMRGKMKSKLRPSRPTGSRSCRSSWLETARPATAFPSGYLALWPTARYRSQGKDQRNRR